MHKRVSLAFSAFVCSQPPMRGNLWRIGALREAPTDHGMQFIAQSLKDLKGIACLIFLPGRQVEGTIAAGEQLRQQDKVDVLSVAVITDQLSRSDNVSLARVEIHG